MAGRARRTRAVASALILATGLDGCGSILHHGGFLEFMGPTRPWSQRVEPYGGVFTDLVAFIGLATPLGIATSLLWVPLVLVDLPLSGLCDTLALPFVLPPVHERRAQAEREAAQMDAHARARAPSAASPAASPPPVVVAPDARSPLDPAIAPRTWARVVHMDPWPGPVDAAPAPMIVHARGRDVGPGSAWEAVSRSAGGLRLVAVDGVREALAAPDLPVALGACVAPTGSWALIAMRGKVVRWTVEGGVDLDHPLLVGGGRGDRIVSVALSRDGRTAAASELRGGTSFAGTPDGLNRLLGGQVFGAYALAVDDAGARVAAGGWDGDVRVWDLAPTASAARLLRRPGGGPASWASAARFCADGTLLVGHDDGRLVRWDGERGTLVARELEPILALAALRDEVLVGCASGSVSVRSAGTGRMRVVLLGHEGLVVDLVTSPDGARGASASHDGTARVWDLATGRELDRVDLRPIGDAPRAIALGDGEGNDGLVVVTRGGLVLRYTAR